MEDLISKKDLLSLTNISYGQLYRWKRKNIIPEEWFIKKSTFTGQETFFPKGKILERIELILSMKDDVSLDDIANMFEKKSSDKTFDLDTLTQNSVINSYTKEIFTNLYSKDKSIGKRELLIISIINNYLVNSIVTIDELKSIIALVDKNFDDLFNDNGKLYLFRKLGISFVVGCKDYNQVIFDDNMIKVLDVDLVKEISNITYEINKKTI
ncbi:MAG: DUF4004 family protein [Paraclostridium sp.]